MPNRFTRVPETPAPELHGIGRAAVPIADAFMVALASRPTSGSLRTTWVTPATLWMSSAGAVGAVALAVLLITGALGPASSIVLVGAAICLLFAVGAASVALVGLQQRRAR